MNTLYSITHMHIEIPAHTHVHIHAQSGNIIDENRFADRLAWTARASGIDQLTLL